MNILKNSGIEWIGNIPSEWGINKIKNVANVYTGNSISDDDKGLYSDKDDAFPYIATKDINIIDNTIDYENGMYTKIKDKKFKIAHTGDTLLCIEGGNAGKKIARLNQNVSFVNKLCCFNSKTIDSNYLYYSIMSDSFTEPFKQNIFGLIGGVSQSVIRQFNICIPNVKEQHLIADFLDEKVNTIDNIICELNSQIEILNKYKKQLISESVTEGLSKKNFKNSKISFIKKIPDNWEEVRTINVLKMPITDGPHETPDLYDDGIPFVSAEAVSCGNGRIDFEHIRGYISEDYYRQCCKKYVPKLNDIYMIKSGATTGKVSIVDTDIIFTIWSPLAVFRANTNKILYKFLYYALNSEYYQMQVQTNWTYGTQQNIGMRTLEKLKIVLPPIVEQMEIVNYLDKKCSEIEEILNSKIKQKEQMEQYKKSVIYEYVTGKKRVEGAEELYG